RVGEPRPVFASDVHPARTITVMARATARRIAKSRSGIGADVSKDDLGEVEVAAEHDRARPEHLVGSEAATGHQRQLRSASLDDGVGLPATRRDLAGSQTPVPGALAGPLDVDADGPAGHLEAGA